MLAFLIDPWFSLVGKTAIRVGIYRVVAANFAKLGREVDGVDNWEFSYPVVAVLAKRDETNDLPPMYQYFPADIFEIHTFRMQTRRWNYRKFEWQIAYRSTTAKDSQTLVSSVEDREQRR